MALADLDAVLHSIKDIAPDNAFINYILKRIQSDDYRNFHVSQQNRIGRIKTARILKAIFSVTPNRHFLIPPGDIGKDALYPKDSRDFERIVAAIKSATESGTANSVKKNLFPDMNRMGFITISEGRQRYGKITSLGTAYLEAPSDAIQQNLFASGVERMFGAYLPSLIGDLLNGGYQNKILYFQEFMYILFERNPENKRISLLDAYRQLAHSQQTNVDKLLQQYANPKNFSGDRTAKRDYQNWKNETQQSLSLLTEAGFLTETNSGYRLAPNSSSPKQQKSSTDFLAGTRRGPPPPAEVIQSGRVYDPTKPTFTYLLRFGSENHWKIGRASDVRKRCDAINTHIPMELKLFRSMKGEPKWSIKRSKKWPNAARADEVEREILDLRKKKGFERPHERAECTETQMMDIWNSVINKHENRES